MVAASRGAPARASPRRRIPSNGFIPPVATAAEGTSLSYHTANAVIHNPGSPPFHPHPYARRNSSLRGGSNVSHQLSGVSVNATVNQALDQLLNASDINDDDSYAQNHHQTPSPASLVSGLLHKIPSFLYTQTAAQAPCIWDSYKSSAISSDGQPPISMHLRSRETGSAKRQKRSAPSCQTSSWREPPGDVAETVNYITARKIPSLLREREFDVGGLDKVFAAAWLSEKDIVIGTKCDRLFVLDADSMKKIEIPTFRLW